MGARPSLIIWFQFEDVLKTSRGTEVVSNDLTRKNGQLAFFFVPSTERVVWKVKHMASRLATGAVVVASLPALFMRIKFLKGQPKTRTLRSRSGLEGGMSFPLAGQKKRVRGTDLNDAGADDNLKSR
jgi:hypothetical protein